MEEAKNKEKKTEKSHEKDKEKEKGQQPSAKDKDKKEEQELVGLWGFASAGYFALVTAAQTTWSSGPHRCQKAPIGTSLRGLNSF